jgi:hypothetical protein
MSRHWHVHFVTYRRGGAAMTDPTCACGNSARYVDQHGKLVCGICPLKAGDDSIKLADVPALLAWARNMEHVLAGFDQLVEPMRTLRQLEEALPALRDIIQRRPA